MLFLLEESREGELHDNLELSIVLYSDKLKGMVLFLHVFNEAYELVALGLSLIPGGLIQLVEFSVSVEFLIQFLLLVRRLSLVDEHMFLQVFHVHNFFSVIHSLRSGGLVNRETCKVFVRLW